jgi:hypothetical protein
MQMRAAALKGDRPSCPLDPKHKVHRHGPYERYANCNDAQKDDIPRFLCVPCERTISVLPNHFLPYRPVPVPLVQKYFDAQADSTRPLPSATEKEKGCLKRAWNHFGRRIAALAVVLGQMLQIRAFALPKPFWLALRRLGNLPGILLRLAKPFNTSLLHDYLCLRPWTSSS